MRLVDGTLAHDGGRDRETQILQGRQRLIAACAVHPAPGDHQRAFRLGQQRRRLGHAGRIGGDGVQRIAAETGLPRGLDRVFAGLVQHIGRHQQHCRAGAPGGRGGEGHVHIVIDARDIGDPAHPFRHAREQRRVIQFLKRILVGERARHVLHDGHDRDRGLQRLGQPRHQERRRRTVLRRHHRHLTRDAGIGIGHGGTGILGAVADLRDPVGRRCQKKGRGDRLAKDLGHAMALQGPGKDMCAGLVRARISVQHWAYSSLQAGIFRMILPVWAEASSRAWASRTCARSKTESMAGRAP